MTCTICHGTLSPKPQTLENIPTLADCRPGIQPHEQTQAAGHLINFHPSAPAVLSQTLNPKPTHEQAQPPRSAHRQSLGWRPRAAWLPSGCWGCQSRRPSRGRRARCAPCTSAPAPRQRQGARGPLAGSHSQTLQNLCFTTQGVKKRALCLQIPLLAAAPKATSQERTRCKAL